ncbi:alpha/beta fold hydrolase [Cryobacterium sp. PH31-AA6]|uniref:alpha/beta hydrolase family protein n=1 Tax=Cryobacterium sp. PH31-AA6 TaxID=3046205 RepID=UPI0024BAE483|nr:alpha/beta fold hydrolase [Cryobacterium sp. PH31-AA6]MDJ0324189.1 alpha/beta fold hydrolase [Cryobacterium sp. PH31-AA6]
MAAGGLAFGGLGLGIARRLTAPASGRTYELTIRDVDNSGERPIVVLDRTPATAAPGLYCLLLETGGLVRLSHEVEDRGPRLIGREVLGEPCEGLAAGQRASWSGIVFSSPEDADLEATDVQILTDVGPAPAWLVAPQGTPSTEWAIHIHGLGSTRAGTLRGVQVASQAGLTSLVVTYRNDGEGPTVGTGRSELGAAEIDDVRAAVRFARENGAGSVILFGWSMGAAIALQLAAESEFRGIAAGLVLESPVLDWVSTIKANCARSGLPAWSGILAIPWLIFRPCAQVSGLANPVDLRRFDWIARADELTVPTLILHGTLDTSSPFELSSHLRTLRPDIVTLEAFDAHHTMSWNSEGNRWRTVVSSWLASLAMGG